MAEGGVQKDIKLTRAEQEKERQAASAARLAYAWPLPGNLSEMKSFAIGMLTWRDVAFLAASFMIPFLLTMPLQSVIGQLLTIVVTVAMGLPFAFLSIKHVFTGDLPFEERLRIAIKDKGESNLLYWDKTKQNGEYVESSTQSFVPMVEFGEDDFVLLPGNEGGFSVIEVVVDDLTQSKNTEVEATVNGFNDLLNALIKDSDCTPVQIMLKSKPKNLASYIEKADERMQEIALKNKPVASARADDYTALLVDLDKDKAYYYSYYMVVTYRKDTEYLAEESMNTASVRREKLRGGLFSPLTKKAKMAKDADLDVGLTEEERKEALRNLNRDATFGVKRTRLALSRRVGIVVNMIRDLGTTHTAVKPRILTKEEIALLIFDCYNTEDKNVIGKVLNQALEEKSAIYSTQMYMDYPSLFEYKTREQKQSKTLEAQKHGLFNGLQ